MYCPGAQDNELETWKRRHLIIPKTVRTTSHENVSSDEGILNFEIHQIHKIFQRIQWMTNLVRGGNHFGDQPA